MSPLKGIDVHVHVHDARARALQGEASESRRRQMSSYFGQPGESVSVEEQAEQYRTREMMAILVNTTDETVTGTPQIPNDFIAETVQQFPDTFLGMGVIDPWQGELARREIIRVKDIGLVGIGELNPGRQHFYPNDRRFYPLWEEAQSQGLVMLFHSGYTAAGTGSPGGAGVKLKYCQPMLLDDVAADFPHLRIIIAHPSWPWTAESLAIARHKANVFIDLSGWSPAYFPDELVRQVNSVIPTKALFGSDAPSLPLDRWLEDFDRLPFKPEVRQKIMVENAAKLFGLEDRVS